MSLIFIHNFFKGLRGKPVACVACTWRYLEKAELGDDLPFLLPSTFFHPARVSAFVSSTIMAPPLNAAQHIFDRNFAKRRV